MREIKFRVWDIDEAEWYKPHEAINMCLDTGELFDTERWADCWLDLDSDKFIIEQFTGLQDSKNVDIYEGDKIEDNVGRIWSISYRDDLATFVFNWKRRKDSWQNYMQFIKSQKPFKITGNIHEVKP